MVPSVRAWSHSEPPQVVGPEAGSRRSSPLAPASTPPDAWWNTGRLRQSQRTAPERTRHGPAWRQAASSRRKAAQSVERRRRGSAPSFPRAARPPPPRSQSSAGSALAGSFSWLGAWPPLRCSASGEARNARSTDGCPWTQWQVAQRACRESRSFRGSQAAWPNSLGFQAQDGGLDPHTGLHAGRPRGSSYAGASFVGAGFAGHAESSVASATTQAAYVFGSCSPEKVQANHSRQMDVEGFIQVWSRANAGDAGIG